MIKQIVKPPGPISQAIGQSLSSILNEISTEIGKDLATGYRNWRQKNLSKVTEKIEALDDRSPLILDADNQIPAGLVYVLANAAASEENDEVQILWARLIISAKLGTLGNEYRAIVKSLEGFTPLMALCLELIFRQNLEFDFAQSIVGLSEDYFELSRNIAAKSDIDVSKALLSLEKEGLISRLVTNLSIPHSNVHEERVSTDNGVIIQGWTSGEFIGVQRVPMKYAMHRLPDGLPGPPFLLTVSLTELGQSLCEVCIGRAE